MKTFMAKDHTFVVCAYKESPYLRECLDSLFAQTVKTNVIMATSTPNDYIRSIAVAYHVPLYFNDGVKSIADDWNFGIAQAKTELVTIAHQDDVYLPEYAESMIDMMNCFQRPLIAFSDYGEIRGTEHVYSNPLLKIKKIMLKPLRSKQLMKSRLVRRRILSLGSPICCPSVTFVRTNLTVPIFKRGFRSNVDWEAWEQISREKGAFVYCNQPLMLHRIHEESATTQIIADQDRGKEDYQMFCKFWPKPIAAFIEYFYSRGEKSNSQ